MQYPPPPPVPSDVDPATLAALPLEFIAGEQQMVSFDLADGFHAVGVHPEHQSLMGYQCAVTGETYCYTVLPFGWCSSPGVERPRASCKSCSPR